VALERRRILKFGGTSVGGPEPLKAALAIVERALPEAPVVVVVSALAAVTDALEAALRGAAAGRLDAPRFAQALRERHLGLLRAVARGRSVSSARAAIDALALALESELRAVSIQGRAGGAERARVLATGERLAAPLVAAALVSGGVDAFAVDASTLVRTSADADEASVDFPATRRLAAALASLPARRVPVVTGFIGADAEGRTTLLGRGGSDYTAAVLGWALEAERVEIWSDVPGVMTADPRRSGSARTLERLGYREAAALARAGAKVLHPRTLEPLEPAGIPVFVGRTLDASGPGTWIGRAAPVRDEDGTAA
jgi:aspartate kinase